MAGFIASSMFPRKFSEHLLIAAPDVSRATTMIRDCWRRSRLDQGKG